MGRSDGTSELESHGDGDTDTCACRVRYGRVARSRGVRERKKRCEVQVLWRAVLLLVWFD